MNRRRLLAILFVITGAFIGLLGVGLVVGKLWVFNYYRIPQDGMYPTMPAGSLAFAWRWPYGSIAEVGRGDVIVFERQRSGKRYLFVWRVLGLPGDNVEVYKDGIRINGGLLSQEVVGREGSYRLVQETVMGVSYLVAYDESMEDGREGVTAIVPPGQVFVLGDNRDHSYDSEDHGAIPFDSIVGRVFWWLAA